MIVKGKDATLSHTAHEITCYVRLCAGHDSVRRESSYYGHVLPRRIHPCRQPRCHTRNAELLADPVDCASDVVSLRVGEKGLHFKRAMKSFRIF